MRWLCLLCFRDKFTRKSPHCCLNGQYRKRRLKWVAYVFTGENQ